MEHNSLQRYGRIIDISISPENRLSLVLACGSEFYEFQGHTSTVPQIGDIVVIDSLNNRELADMKIIGRPSDAWNPLNDGMRWRQPSGAPTRLQLLHKRQLIVRALRDYFFREDFLDVDAPLLVRGACPDVSLDPIPADKGFLSTSTEYHIKRMMVGGVERAFTITHNFRADEVGQIHNPEFTMAEWARAYASLEDIENDARGMIISAFQAIEPNKKILEIGNSCINIFSDPWMRLPLREGLCQFLGVEIDECFSLKSLRLACKTSNLDIPESMRSDRHGLISVLTNALLPLLGFTIPTFLIDWPAFMTSSAELNPSSPSLVKRSELIIAGVEISDGFPFLVDYDSQCRQFTNMLRKRSKLGKPPVKIEESYLSALAQGLPPGAGMALGVDRLVMLLTGQTEIRKVISFAWDEL